MLRRTIPVNRPLLDGMEETYLRECIETGWVSSEGPFVQRFEEGMARLIGRRFAAAVTNGTAALELALHALRVGPGDEVILPSFTIISCAAAILRCGATPVLVDSHRDTWNMDPIQVAARVTPRTRAIMVVHIYGLPVDLDPIVRLARSKGIFIIEDAAEQIGQTYRGEPVGSFGDITALSFYPNKHITTGEGGMVLTDDARLDERCRYLRNLCFSGERRYVHDELGWNLRMSNLQAALGVAQLERIEKALARKRQIGVLYQTHLADCECVELPVDSTPYASNIYWVFGLVLKDDVGFDSADAILRLKGLGIDSRPFFWPMHEQPVFAEMGLFADERYPQAERIARRGLYLPSGLGISDEEIAASAAALKRIFA
jgi:perosamine synthetase